MSGWFPRRDPLLSGWKWLDEETEEGKTGQEIIEEVISGNSSAVTLLRMLFFSAGALLLIH